MHYAMLIYADETIFPAKPEAERQEIFAAYRAFREMLEKAGTYRGAVKLTDTSSATNVRVRDGKTLTTDGPFAESKEHLAGLFIVECEDLDAALASAAKIPSARFGTIEVRPIEFLGLG